MQVQQHHELPENLHSFQGQFIPRINYIARPFASFLRSRSSYVTLLMVKLLLITHLANVRAEGAVYLLQAERGGGDVLLSTLVV